MGQTEGVGPCGSADCFCGPELERLRAIAQRVREKADAPRRLDGSASWDVARYILGEGERGSGLIEDVYRPCPCAHPATRAACEAAGCTCHDATRARSR